MTAPTSTFRKVSLERLSSPEQLDQKITVVPQIGWVAVVALALLVAAALVWGILGTISIKVYGSGVLMYYGGIAGITSHDSGRVSLVHVSAGDTVAAGQTIAELDDGSVIEAEISGTISSFTIRPGNFVQVGSVVGNIVGSPDTLSSRAVIYVPLEDGKMIEPGMEVFVTPSTANRQEHGYILGRVVSISASSVTHDHMMFTLQNSQLVQRLSGGDPVMEAVIELYTDASTVSGFSWSTPRGTPFAIVPGTVCFGEIIVAYQRPIDMVIPFLRGIFA